VTRRAALIAGGAVTVLFAAAVVPSLRTRLIAPDVPVLEVRRQPFARRISSEGNLKAVRATPLTTPVESQGPLKIAWLAPEGRRVATGDVVVRFDPTDKEKEVADGRADRDASERKIAKKRAEDDATLKNLDRDAGQARLELENARTFRSKDPEIFSRIEIIESQIDETLAQERVDHASTSRTTRASLSTTDVELLAIERRKADLKVRQGEKGLRALEVRAPHDGILTYRRDWRGEPPRVGESVWMGEPLAEIPELDNMEAEVYVLEADAGGLAVDLPATVVLEAHPGMTYRAKVKRVDTLARPRLRGTPVQYFSLTLELERTDPAVMKPGQRVRAEVVVDERASALVVPREAVTEKDGKKIVYRQTRSGFEPVEVALGPEALGRVVLEKGIEEGDRIAVRDPTRPAEEPVPEDKAPSAPSAPARSASPVVVVRG